jgi:hypothetical protein
MKGSTSFNFVNHAISRTITEMVMRVEKMNLGISDRMNEARSRDSREAMIMGKSSRNLLLAAGLFYLGLIVFGIFAQVIRMDIVVPEDAVATVGRITSSGGMLTIAFLADLVSDVCFVLLGLTCYRIFERIGRGVAVVMLLFVVVSGTFAFINLVHVFEALQIVGGPVAGIDSETVMMHLNQYSGGSYLAQVLGWGPWLVPLGYLGYRSGIFPKAIGATVLVGGVGLTAQGFQYFLLPGMGDLFAPGVLISIIGEFSVCGWMLYRGRKKYGETKENERDIDPQDAIPQS